MNPCARTNRVAHPDRRRIAHGEARRRSLLGRAAIATAVCAILAASANPAAEAAKAKSRAPKAPPGVTFSDPATADFEAMLTFSVPRASRQIAGVACSLTNEAGATSTASCGAPAATSKKSTSFQVGLSGLDAGAYTYAVIVTLTDGKRLMGDTTLDVEPEQASCTVTPYSVVYDASPHTATGSCTGVGGVVLPASNLALGSTTHTNAGTYTDGWSFSDPEGNYTDQTGSIIDVIGQRDQAITFGAAPIDPSVGGSYTPSATATSGFAVSFSISSATSANCSLGAGAVDFDAAGTCTVEARQAGDSNWAAAPVAEQSFTIAPGDELRDQEITFGEPPPHPRVGSSYTPAATATSGLPVAFTIDSSATAYCSLSEGVVHLLATGLCVVNADQPGDAEWAPALTAQQEFQVTDDPIVPHVVVNEHDDPQSPPLPPDPQAEFCVPQSLAAGGCALNALDGTIENVFDASGSGYPAEPDLYTFLWEIFYPPGLGGSLYKSFGISGYNSPVLLIRPNSFPSLAGTAAGQDIFWRVQLTVTEKAGAHLASVTYFRFDYQQSTLTLQMSSDCQRIRRIDGVECTLDAANGLPATDSTFTFGPAPVDPRVGGSYTPSVVAPYALPVTLSIADSTSANCSIDSSGLVSFLQAGACTVEARGPADPGFASPRAVQTFVIGASTGELRDQEITFGAAPPHPRVGSSYTPAATATSGLPVAFTIDSSATAYCSLSEGVVHLLAIGLCVVNADQPGDAEWAPALTAQQEFQVTDDPIIPKIFVNRFDDPQSPPVPPDPVANNCPPQSINGGGCAINPLDGTIDNFFDALDSGYPKEPDLYTFRWEIFKPPGLAGAPWTSFGIIGYDSPVLLIRPSSLPSLAGTDAGQDIFWRVRLTVTEKAGARLSTESYFRFDYQQSSLTLQMANDCQRIGHLQGDECILESANGLPATDTPFTFGPAPIDPRVGGSYTPSVEAPYDLPVVASIASSTSANCSIDGNGLVSFLQAGTCTVEARVLVIDPFDGLPRGVQTFVIGASTGP